MSDPAAADGEFLASSAVNPNNPQNLLAGWTQDNLRGNLVAASLDGGRNWTIGGVPGVSECTGNPAYKLAAHAEPSFGGDGRAYVVSSVATNSCFSVPSCDTTIFVNHSTDGGLTWSAPAMVVSGVFPAVIVQDAHLAAHPQRPKTAYVIWTEFDALGALTPVRLSRTSDGGVRWGAPEALPVQAPPGRVTVFSQLRVLPDGSLLVVYLEADHPFSGAGVRDMGVWTLQSKDDGTTWSAPVKVVDIPGAKTRVSDPDTDEQLWLAGFELPSIAVAPDGVIYISWHLVHSTFSSQIVFSKSTDGGLSWSGPADIAVENSQAFLPTVVVGADGTVGATYYDFSSDHPNDAVLTTNLWFRHSHDGGTTWHEDHLSGPFDSRRDPPPPSLPRLWYAGVTPAPDGFGFVFGQPNAPVPPNASRSDTGPNDIWFSHLRVTP